MPVVSPTGALLCGAARLRVPDPVGKGTDRGGDSPHLGDRDVPERERLHRLGDLLWGREGLFIRRCSGNCGPCRKVVGSLAVARDAAPVPFWMLVRLKHADD